MFKGLGNIAGMMKQFSEMQGKMQEMQEKLGQLRFEGSAGGGMVNVEANGQQKILNCKIDQTLFDSGDKEMIEDLLIAATNQALDKAREGAAEEMAQITGGMNIPGLEDALSKFNPNA
ncbi:YbaB/EbfC family nucleoid-associated protein [Gimesia fumaroli]|jgi:DNA-binding YbaB/EbfC family protein|uniref:Nucleoid-associated protein Enr17x_28010 n=1 Tax=Gimesia fumaroli TaxID=2527976 RepID=A0A518ICC4_9PLAN|nr:YbaB/EbfC family nucleoid-associated protein [Gimesia fumaroli]QDV50758.1 Nucleoid-associated protein [Gimesia fumaroli]